MRYLLQISDCHISPEPGGHYYERDSELLLKRVVAHALSLGISFDAVLLSGDLVHHGELSAYERLLQTIQPLPGVRCWVAGNHDNSEQMDRFDISVLKQSELRLGRWRLLLLDSNHLPDGKGSGSISPDSLEWLESSLSKHTDAPTLIAMHHNPLPTGTPWQDQIMLANADEFWSRVKPHSQVKGVLCGHVHQALELQYAGINMWSAPSTAVQFKPGVLTVTTEDDPQVGLPGYRWYELHPDGQIVAHLERVQDVFES